jgi:hypothetical protein
MANIVTTATTTTTKAISCSCKHPVQDSWYGFSLRIHNKCGSVDTTSWRCTVCGNETRTNFGTAKKGKK